ncbi:MAG: hypothetical protein IT560_05465 [Alphaproteobacteria bacterium]|nr:hypothetical protein [Alphaproteobacteria bacterium]
MADTLEYPYKVNVKKMGLLIPFIAGLAVFMAHLGMTNDRGLILFHVIHLDVENARIFYWAMSVILGLSAGACLVAVITQLNAGDATVLRIADDGFTIPVGFFEKRMEFVRYSDITKLTMMSVQGQNYMVIRHMGGKISLQQQSMENRDSYLVASGTIMANCPHLKDKA